MKFFTNQKNSKKIIISLLLVMLFNFSSPTISNAATSGGVLFDAVCDLLTTIGDYLIEGLQGYFTGVREITKTPVPGVPGEEEGSEYDEYIIAYSPGIIFSGKVAALKTNFINAKSDDKETLTISDYEYTYKKTLDTSEAKTATEIGEMLSTDLSGLYSDEDLVYTYWYADPDMLETEFTECDYVWVWYHNDREYVAIMIDAYMSKNDAYELASGAGIGFMVSLGAYFGVNAAILALQSVGVGVTTINPLVGAVIVVVSTIAGLIIKYISMKDNTETTYEDMVVYERKMTTKSATKESLAFKLKDTIATWYSALRTIALVGLLSILVYIAIRILISTTSQEKAKYKKLIFDWLVAISLLFILHYIMLFITEISQKITDLLAVEVIDTQGSDIFMTSIRQSIELQYERGFVYIVMYVVLVVYTIVFTVQYVKRFFYLAFFTMIAPLVALTYPLDKMKDGQAQAFSVWLREYIFNSLLQPMHLLLYYIFVSAALELAITNMVYAIVSIGFLLPAEKFFRKMFGFDKAESAKQVNAAVGGALVANAINNAAKKAGRMASKGLSSIAGGASGGGSGGGNIRTAKNAGAAKEAANKGKSKAKDTSSMGKDSNSKTDSNNNKTFNRNVNKAGDKGKVSLKNGVKTLAGRYNPLNKTNRRKLLKGAGRLTRKAVVGAAGAAALGTVGLAIGTATGDAGKALGYGAAGAGAGYAAANNLGDRAAAFEKENRERFKEGALGTDEYNTRNSIKELSNDNDFNKVCSDLGIKNAAEKEQMIRQFHSNGITSSEDIKKSMNVRAETGATQDEVIAAYKIKERAEADKLERDDIIKRLSRQGVKDKPGDKKLSRAMEIIDKFYD